MSSRELILAWITAVTVFFAGTYLVCRPYLDKWKAIRAEVAACDAQIRDARELLSGQAEWERRLDELRKTVQPLPSDRAADNSLKRTISEIASAIDTLPEHRMKLSDRIALEEETHVGLHVLPITCGMGEANTLGLERLLRELQTNSVVFDVRELVIRSTGKDKLNGNFTVNCIYTKQEESAK